MAYKVFISYSSKNKAAADLVCEAIEARGVPCWIAPRDISPGQEWSEAIIHALNECRVMVIVFSSGSNLSQQVKREAERAVHKGIALLPIRIEDIYPSGAMEYYLSTAQWVDALPAPIDKHLPDLVERVHNIFSENVSALGGAASTADHKNGSASATTATPRIAAEKEDASLAPLAHINRGGFNVGAFLRSVAWLKAHRTNAGCWMTLLTRLPSVVLVFFLMTDWNAPASLPISLSAAKWSLITLLILGILARGFIATHANRWAHENRVWINEQHFRKVQTAWLVRGIALWVVVALTSSLFVRQNWRHNVMYAYKFPDRSYTETLEKFRGWLSTPAKNPRVTSVKDKVKHKMDGVVNQSTSSHGHSPHVKNVTNK